MLIILSEHASIYREEQMKKRSEKPMKKGLYSWCLLARMLARMLARGPVRRLRSFGASRAKPETNVGFNPLHKIQHWHMQCCDAESSLKTENEWLWWRSEERRVGKECRSGRWVCR